MRIIAGLFPILLIAGCGNADQTIAGVAKKSDEVAMLPDRLLKCTLARALNLDPSRKQTIAEVKYEGSYRFTLFLPSVPVRRTPPPDPTEKPEPVHPETRIIDDPHGLAKEAPPGFERVVDLWPERVEMTQTISAPLTQLLILSDGDQARGTINLFLTQATDAATFDLKNVYQGGCTVETGPAARKAAPRG